jgi:hypothetical protein
MEIGRPPVLDDVKKREICAILAVGCNRETAARYVGCHRTTITKTAQRDESFALALAQAESKYEIVHLSHINKAATEGRYWRAAAWALERKFPLRYGTSIAESFTFEQVTQVLSQFAEALLEEVPEDAIRERILARLGDLTAELRAATKDDAR